MSMTPEAYLLFAWLKAECGDLPAKRRVERLKTVAAILDDWEHGPVNLRCPQEAEMAADAAAMFRRELPRLLA
jgi:hypothetical protein